ncbi:hypothetical protein [Streptomyces sp. SID2888]|uniref:hypothetical protein n=1 Tax=Streptomyces sp. SID2888 TaxID=2690256 RepID=UPI00137113B5|nr:hypothetical protein [Streptomyces sp. SID2888]MYV47129.1 hypothetical protein [Streptomyces sp. SID2888]
MLNRLIVEGDRLAADAEAGEVLDHAHAHVADAKEHLQTAFAAAGHADDRARQFAKLAESEGKSRIALRLAGTSLKEYRELTHRLSGERAAYIQMEADAKRDARQALREAWDAVQQSRFAESFGVARTPVPDHVEKVAERLVEMRSVAERRGHSMDKRDRDDVGRATRQAGEFRAYAAGHRAQAADARAEKALRATIAEKHPELYDREVTGRRSFQQARQAQQTAQHRQAAAHLQPKRSRGRGL